MTNHALLIHNPNCSKSRHAIEILQEKAINFKIVEYLQIQLTDEFLMSLPKLLNLSFVEMVRKSEKPFTELGLDQRDLSDQEWVETLKKHPILLERPIFINGGRGVIARPPERLLDYLVPLNSSI